MDLKSDAIDICFKKENIHGLRKILTLGINYSKHTKPVEL